MYHVAITGRDRRHLSDLGAKLRVIVVGYREEKRGIVVDAYIPAEKSRLAEAPGLRRDPPRGGGCARSPAPGGRPNRGRHPAEAGALRRRDLGRRLSDRRRGRDGDRARGEEPRRILRTNPVAEPHLGEAALPRHSHRQGAREGTEGRLLHRGCSRKGVGQPRHPRLLRDPAAPRLPRSEGHPAREPDLHGRADPQDRREDGRHPLPSGEPRRPPLQHGAPSDVAEEPPAGAARPRPPLFWAWTSIGISHSSGASIVISPRARSRPPSTPGTTRRTWEPGRPPSPRRAT